MRVFKPLKLGLSTRVQPYGGAGLFVVTTFTLFDLLDPTDILAETALWPLAGQELPKGAILDEGMPKPHGEVLVAGKAMAPKGRAVPEMAVGFEVGEVHRVFNIFGNREWVGDPSEPTISAPQPFTEMPLIAEHAFGGEGYAQNPVGIGFHDESLLATGFTAPLPNVEIWGKEVLEPTDHPRPALIGPVGPGAPERIALAGTYDQAWIDHRMPEFPDDFDPRYHHAAPHDQRVQGFFAGDEPIYLIGMSADHPEVISRLPGVRARAFVKRASDPEGLREVRMHADTVWLFGSQLKGVVINRGAIAIADRDGLDVGEVMVGYEWASEPERSWDHYAEVFRLRSDREEGYKYMLADSQLAPTIPEDVQRAREQKRLEQAEARAQKSHENMEWNQRKQLENAGLPPEVSPDIPKPDTKPFLLPLPEEIAQGDIDIARLMSDAAELQREAEVKAALVNRAVEQVTAQFDAPAQDLPVTMSDEELAIAQAELGPGPGFLPPVDDMLSPEQLNDVLSQIENHEDVTAAFRENMEPEEHDDLSRILGAFDEPPSKDDETAFEQACARALCLPEGSPLSEIRQKLNDVNTDDLSLDVFGDAEDLDASPTPSDDTMDSFLKEVAAGDPDADVSGLDSLDAKIAKSFPALDAEDGESAVQALLKSLQAVDLPDPVSPAEQVEQARGQLDEVEGDYKQAIDEARLASPIPIYPLEALGKNVATRLGAFIQERLKDGHSFAGADLAGADLAGADFRNCDLTGTCFETCNLVGAHFEGANCSKAVFTGANLTGADFRKANLTEANLSNTQSRHAVLAGCRLSDSRIAQADFIDVDLTGANLERVTVLESDFGRCRLDNAIMSDCTFAEVKCNGLSADGAELEKVVFAVGSFDNSSWQRAQLTRVTFAKVSFSGSNFTAASLKNTSFAGNVDLTASSFAEAKAVNCGFPSANISGANFHMAQFETCNFLQADLSNANLRLASMQKSIFNYAILRQTDAFGAMFRGSGFRAADLHSSSFRGANLYQADLSEACLVGIDFTGARINLTNMEAPASR